MYWSLTIIIKRKKSIENICDVFIGSHTMGSPFMFSLKISYATITLLLLFKFSLAWVGRYKEQVAHGAVDF